MAHLKKNMNMILLSLVILLTLSLVALTSYYHSTYSRLSSDYYIKLGELQDISSDLLNSRERLNETMTQYNLKDERERDLSDKYLSLKTDKETLQDNLNTTTATLNAKTKELANTQDELDSKIRDLETKKLELINLNAQLENSQTKINEYDRLASSLDRTIDYFRISMNEYQGDTNLGICQSAFSDLNSKFLEIKSVGSELNGVSS